MIINYNRKRVLGASVPPIADFDDAYVVYSLEKFYSWSSAIVKIRRSSDSAVKWVFFDGDTVTLSSFVGDDRSTPSATTLSTWIGSDSGYCAEWIGQTFDDVLDTAKILPQTTTTQQPVFINSGVLVTKNSKIGFDLTGNRFFYHTTGLSALDWGNSYSVMTVSSQHNATGIGAYLICTDVTNLSPFVMMNDNGVNENLAWVRGISPLTIVKAELLAQQNNTNQKILSAVIETDGTNTISSYYNDVPQTLNSVWSLEYRNIVFRLGTGNIDTNGLDGIVQEVIIFPSDKNSLMTDLNDLRNDYYSIY